MNKTLTALLALAALGAAHAQSGLKAGLWENRTTLMTVDGKDMAAVLRAAAEQQQKEIASLPPEQRKQAEAVLGRQGGDPLVRRVCISAEMARNEQLLVPAPGARRLRAADGQARGRAQQLQLQLQARWRHADRQGRVGDRRRADQHLAGNQGEERRRQEPVDARRVPHEVPGQRLRRRQAAVRADGGGVGRQQGGTPAGARQIERGKALIAID